MQTKAQIEELLERFLEGKTSNAEEKELYAYFVNPDIPEELMPYRPMFGYFENGIIEELKNKEAAGLQKENGFMQNKSFLIGLCAAAVLLLFIVNVFIYRGSNDFQIYEGSYIVRNGIRITDIDKIKPELEAIIRNVEQQEKQAEQWIYDSREPEECCIFENMLSEKHKEILANFPDERIRGEVLEMLRINGGNKHLNK